MEMTSKPPTIGRLADTRARWREYRSAAAVRAVADAYRQFLVETGGDEQAASNLTRAWALLVKRDFPGMPPEIYTEESLNRWLSAQRPT
jgi:hypothetical protein